MIIFSRACGYFVFVCFLIGVEWEWFCVHEYACVGRICSSFTISWGLHTNIKWFCWWEWTAFLASILNARDFQSEHIMQFNCICLSIDRITWLLENANQKVASISHWIRNCSQAGVFVLFQWKLFFYLLWFSLLLFFCILSTFLISFHYIYKIFFVMYCIGRTVRWLVCQSVGRILFLFCMNVHCNKFNVFVLVYVHSFDWMQLWAAVRTRERVKKMIKRMVFLTDCNHTRKCAQ